MAVRHGNQPSGHPSCRFGNLFRSLQAPGELSSSGRLLAELTPGGMRRELSANKVQALLAPDPPGGRRGGGAPAQRPRPSCRHPRSRCPAQVSRRSDHCTVAQSGTTLTGLYGIGPVIAGRILAEAGDVARFATKDKFASYNGTALINVSSGDQVRQRRLRPLSSGPPGWCSTPAGIRSTTCGCGYPERSLGPHGDPSGAIGAGCAEFIARHSRPAGHGLRSAGRIGEDHRPVLQPPLTGEPEVEPGGVHVLEQPLP
jgi:Transposase IS116/IS110/IS902 family